MKEHSVVVVFDAKMGAAEVEKWNTSCRTTQPKAISFIYVRSQGVFASVFVDHGDHHLINDKDGENPMVRIVESIEQGENALVRFSVPEGQTAESMPENCVVEFSDDIIGMDGIAEHTEVIETTGETIVGWKTSTKDKDPTNSIRIGDTSKLPAYVKGGTMTEKKVATKVPSKSFAETFKNPGMPFMDMCGTDMLEFGSELQLHVALGTQLTLVYCSVTESSAVESANNV